MINTCDGVTEKRFSLMFLSLLLSFSLHLWGEGEGEGEGSCLLGLPLLEQVFSFCFCLKASYPDGEDD